MFFGVVSLLYFLHLSAGKVCSLTSACRTHNKIRLSGSASLLFFRWGHAENITDRELNVRVHRKFELKFVTINRDE